MKDTCPSGHPYDEENTYLREDGRYECRACDRERHVAHYPMFAFFNDFEPVAAALPAPGPTRPEVQEEADRLLSLLTPLKREIVTLWMHGVPMDVTAEMVGRTPDCVRVHRNHALAKLRKAVAA